MLGTILEVIGALVIYVFFVVARKFNHRIKKRSFRQILRPENEVLIINLYTNGFKNQFIGIVSIVVIAILVKLLV